MLSFSLTERATQLVREGVQPSTRVSYGYALDCYKAFTRSVGIPLQAVSRQSVLRFIAYMDAKHLTAATMRVYLSGLRYYCILHQLPYSWREDPAVRLAVRAVELKSAGKRTKLPITRDVLFRIKDKLSPSFDDQATWAAFSLAHFGLLRVSELTSFTEDPTRPSITCDDVQTSTGSVRVRLKRSIGLGLRRSVFS